MQKSKKMGQRVLSVTYVCAGWTRLELETSLVTGTADLTAGAEMLPPGCGEHTPADGKVKRMSGTAPDRTYADCFCSSYL